MRSPTGPWLRGARFEQGLLIPARPRRWALDLLLTPEQAMLRGSGQVVLPWGEHLGLLQSQATTSHGWNIGPWAGRGGELGAALHLRGDLASQSSSIPLLRSALVRWNATPNWGALAPLHRQSLGFVGHQADYDVVHALCTTLAERPELRPRLVNADLVTRLVQRIISTPHHRRPNEDGARRRTVEVITCLRSMGLTHPIGGRPLPDQVVAAADEILPDVVSRLAANPYARSVEFDDAHVRRVIERVYSNVPAWPFEPLFD